MAEKSGPVQVARCEKHGIAYNAAVDSGCVRCRKEKGGAAPAATVAAAPTDSASLLVQGILAVALIVGSGGLFFSAHSTMLASFEGLLSLSGQGGQEMPALDDPELQRLLQEGDSEAIRKYLEESMQASQRSLSHPSHWY